MALFSFIIYILIKSILSKSQENEYNSIIDNKESNDFNLIQCFNLSEKRNITKCILKEVIAFPEDAYESILFFKDSIIIPYAKKNLGENLSYIIGDLLNGTTNTIFRDLFDIIKKNDSDSKNVLDYFIDILSKDQLTNNFIFGRLKMVINFPGFSDLFIRIYERYKDYLYDIIELFPKIYLEKKTIVPVLLEIKDFVLRHKDLLFELICKITSHYFETNKILADIRDFVINNCTNTTFLKDLNKIIVNRTLVDELSAIIKLDDKDSDTIFKIIIANEKLMNLAFGFLNNNTFVEEFADVLMNLTDVKYINKHVPKFIKDTIGQNITVKDILIDAYKNILRSVVTELSLKDFMSRGLSRIFRNLIVNNYKHFNVSENCTELFNYTYFNPPTNDKFRFYYTKKLFIDSTKSKNDFLTYENCLNGYENSNYSTEYLKKYHIIPIYVVAKLTDKTNRSKVKNSTYYEKYNYMIGFCFPQGSNKTTGEHLCSNEDYGSLIKIFNSLSNNVFNATIKVFNITEKDIKGEPRHFIYFLLIVIISAIPLFIWIFLTIYKNVKLSNLQNNEINNELKIVKKNKIKKAKKTNEILNNEFSHKKMEPKWFRHLNEYFNLEKNGSELFNFTLNQTNFNDFNGITYIKGILGISMILNIFGFTFLFIANLITKKLGSYQFYDSLYNPLYIIAFIGLRYSPRIIFSCSGYTLIYKFLNFIEHDSNFCFIKFIILQSYKFILLILATIYLRFCIYYIDVFFLNIKNPTTEVFNEELIQFNKEYFFNFISFLFYNIKDKDEIFAKESAFIPYLYLPINEIILFIIGISLISLGYKFKLRFDIIIIISFLLIYLFKLVLFIVHLYKKEFYSTLYFFLHGYGILMFNPIFNFPSFLVGMYFGLVNFTIQRGINNLNKDEKNNEYELLDKDQISLLKENKSSESNIIDMFISNNSENEKTLRALTFNRDNSSILNENNIYVENESNKSINEEYEKTKKYLDINSQIETNDILTEMPFLKSTVNFTNFHRKNQNNILLKIILAIFIIFILSFIFVRYIFIYINITKELKEYNEKGKVVDESNKRENPLTNILSLEKVITNYFLNIIYVIDIELVVIMINWIFFYLYFKGGQINDFLSHIYWSFFIKSYFSYSLVSSLVILYILYQSETIIKMNISAIFLYSLISSFFIFIAIIIFYTCYEYPLRKIFKTLKFRRTYINLDDEDFYQEESEVGSLK